jgi:hypothetical protein
MTPLYTGPCIAITDIPNFVNTIVASMDFAASYSDGGGDDGTASASASFTLNRVPFPTSGPQIMGTFACYIDGCCGETTPAIETPTFSDQEAYSSGSFSAADPSEGDSNSGTVGFAALVGELSGIYYVTFEFPNAVLTCSGTACSTPFLHAGYPQSLFNQAIPMASLIGTHVFTVTSPTPPGFVTSSIITTWTITFS